MTSDSPSSDQPRWIMWAAFSAVVIAMAGVLLSLVLADLAIRSNQSIASGDWVPLGVALAYSAAVVLLFGSYRLREWARRRSRQKRVDRAYEG